jgi:hypothetical protein
MSGTSSSTLIVSNAVQGTYVFTVKVTDNKGATAMDTVRLKVNPPLTSSASPEKRATFSGITIHNMEFRRPDEPLFFKDRIVKAPFVTELKGWPATA